MPYYKITLNVPQRLLQKLEEIERKYGVKKEDIVLRAVVKLIEQEMSE